MHKKNDTSNKSATCFKKINFYELDDDQQLICINNLLKFHVDIDQYKKTCTNKRSSNTNQHKKVKLDNQDSSFSVDS
jgi:hypothetical protein